MLCRSKLVPGKLFRVTFPSTGHYTGSELKGSNYKSSAVVSHIDDILFLVRYNPAASRAVYMLNKEGVLVYFLANDYFLQNIEEV